MKKLLVTLLLATSVLQLFAQLKSSEIAKLYFIEAEKRFNDNDYTTALEYIDKTENELGETNGRILNLKVKTLYNSGDFRGAQEALGVFINQYASSVTPEIKDETMSYFIKLERYFEKKTEEENYRAAETRKRDESLKFYRYVGCHNHCSNGYVSQEYNETCSNCDGTGLTTKYDYAQAFANGFNGTNNATSYKVTCTTCNGYRTVRATRMVACGTCNGAARLLEYYGSTSYSADEIRGFIANHREQIDFYINLRDEITKNSKQTFFAVKNFRSGLFGFCDRNMTLIVPYRYDKAEIIGNDQAIVTSGSLSGIVNSKNQLILPVEYEWIRKVSENSLIVGKASKQYLVDLKGKPKGPTVESYFAYGDHLVIFKNNSRYGVMDTNGTIVNNATYDNVKVHSWDPFIVAFRTNNQWRLFRLTTVVKELYPEGFTEIIDINHNNKKMLLLKNGATTKISKTDGVLLSDDAFDEVVFNEKVGMMSLKKGALYGLYEISGDRFIAPKYDVLFFNELSPDRALVAKNGLYGIIDSQDRAIIPIAKVKAWFNSNAAGFVVQEKENSKKRFVYDINGNFWYDYKDK
jgi:hypothetical protein